MTNLEKLIQVLGSMFPGTKFVKEELKDALCGCGALICDKGVECGECSKKDFWSQEYIYPKTREYHPKFHTGYMVMVEDEGAIISYSGCIHPSYSNAVDELDNAEYHGWNAHIKSVEFMMKGGEWKNG